MRVQVMAFAVAVLCLAGVACSEDESKDFVPGAGPILTGSTTITPSVEGAWVLASTPAASGCGALNVLHPTESVLTIVQAGNDLVFTLKDSCGRAIPGGSGRVEVGGTIELLSESVRGLSATCSLEVTQALNGLVEKPPNLFTGSDVLTVAGSDAPGSDQCDATLPCSVSGTFTATRCPRGVCSVTCVP